MFGEWMLRGCTTAPLSKQLFDFTIFLKFQEKEEIFQEKSQVSAIIMRI